MKILFNRKFLEHNKDSYYEGAYRLKDFAGEKDTFYDGEKYLSLIYSDRYIHNIKQACYNNETLAEANMTKESYEAALLAVGLTVLASKQNDFAVVRPPGHHSERNRARGFCFFNNIAIAAQDLVNQGKRVFIFDFDAHHGNGTQQIFYKTDKVLYCSIHQMYTFPLSGFSEIAGGGAGKGYSINYPIVPGSGNKEFKVLFEKALAHGREFNPDFVAVSAGFDGYKKDRVLSLSYTKNLFFDIGYKLRRTFSNVFATLEGGYHEDIRPCVDLFIEGVNKGARPPRIKWDPDMSIG